MRNLHAAFLLWACWLPSVTGAATPEQVPLFVSGEGGYHTYRIPATAVNARGVVLAFCEGRKTSARDDGDIDLLVRRSLDGGRTWDRCNWCTKKAAISRSRLAIPAPSPPPTGRFISCSPAIIAGRSARRPPTTAGPFPSPWRSPRPCGRLRSRSPGSARDRCTGFKRQRAACWRRCG